MDKHDIKVQYLYHSGFQVETQKHIFVFDYYKGSVEFGDKPLYVFSSHSHPDHFNPAIFRWQNQKQNIRYILSSDIEPVQKTDNILIMSPYEEILVDDLHIKTFGSTDLGVSFLVQALGINIFHAGDLNWWYWWRDTQDAIKSAESLFKEEMAKIKGHKIDIAFFPVDSRLEHYYAAGADYFIKEIKPQYLIPMHFGEDLETPARYAEMMKKSMTQVIKISQVKEQFNLKI